MFVPSANVSKVLTPQRKQYIPTAYILHDVTAGHIDIVPSVDRVLEKFKYIIRDHARQPFVVTIGAYDIDMVGDQVTFMVEPGNAPSDRAVRESVECLRLHEFGELTAETVKRK